MDFKQFIAVLRRRWRTIVAMILVGLAIAGAVCVIMTPKYSSRSTVFLTVDVSSTTDAYAAALFAQGRAASYADLVTSSTLTEEVIAQLSLDMTPDELADAIDAEVVQDTTQIEIVVTDDDAKQAQTIARLVSQRFTELLAEVETTGSGKPQVSGRIVDEADYDPDAVRPKVPLYLGVAAIIGLLVGVALAVARDLLDRTIRSMDDVHALTDAPVLASIGFDSDIADKPLLTDLSGFASRTEAFRLLRTNLQFIDVDHSPRCLVISSAVPGEGKTMTSVNLAVALAQTGRRVLLIDADLRRPRLATQLGLDPAVGMTTALVGQTTVEDAVQVHEPSGLHFLASGPKPPNPTEILQSRVTAELIRRLQSSYDMVIIDAPPLLPVADAAVLSTIADGTIVVVRHGKTNRDQVSEALNRVTQVGGNLYGVVVNMVAKRAVGGYYYYYEETAPEARHLTLKLRSKTDDGAA